MRQFIFVRVIIFFQERKGNIDVVYSQQPHYIKYLLEQCQRLCELICSILDKYIKCLAPYSQIIWIMTHNITESPRQTVQVQKHDRLLLNQLPTSLLDQIIVYFIIMKRYIGFTPKVYVIIACCQSNIVSERVSRVYIFAIFVALIMPNTKLKFFLMLGICTFLIYCILRLNGQSATDGQNTSTTAERLFLNDGLIDERAGN